MVCAVILQSSCYASNDCFADNLVVDEYWFTAEQDKFTKHFILASTSHQGPFLTKAKYHLNFSSDSIQSHFDFETNNIGLPYNIYAVQLDGHNESTGKDETLINYDFTDGCTMGGYSLYPRGKLNLESVSFHPAIRVFHLKIWGHL